MKDDALLPTQGAAAKKKDAVGRRLFGKGRYKLWALAGIILLAFWSIFTGTVTLKWSAGSLNADDIDESIYDDLDVLEIEEREKVVRHMWDVYTDSHRIELPRFWQDAFEAAYEVLASDERQVRGLAVTEIAKMSLRILDFEPPPPAARSESVQKTGEKNRKEFRESKTKPSSNKNGESKSKS